MPLTHDQKAQAGVDYIDEIKKRIETRTAAQKKTAESKDSLGSNSPKLKGFAEFVVQHHNLPGTIKGCSIEDKWNDETSRRRECLKVKVSSGLEIYIPVSHLPDLTAAMRERQKADDLQGELCREIEFLHAQMSPSRVASFQAYVARLWSPSSKGETLPATRFKRLFEDYIQAVRPAVCQVA